MTLERRDEIERLYHAALQRSERAQFPVEACVGGGALRREIESLHEGKEYVG